MPPTSEPMPAYLSRQQASPVNELNQPFSQVLGKQLARTLALIDFHNVQRATEEALEKFEGVASQLLGMPLRADASNAANS